MASPRSRDADGETGLRSTAVAVMCASFSLFYVIVVLGCSTFCFSRGRECGGDGQIYYVPFLLFPFCLMTSVIFVLTLCSRLKSKFKIKLVLALIVLFVCPSLVATVIRHEIYLTTVVFLLPVTVSLLGGSAYLTYALSRNTA